MTDEQAMIDRVRAELGKDPRIGLEEHPILLEWRDGVLTMEGEVGSVAAKKLALEQAAKLRGVSAILDRLRVMPAERMADGEVAQLLGDALIQENAFAAYTIKGAEAGKPILVLQAPDRPSGSIDFSVEEGVVTLNGQVAGLDQKRLAGVLAWWIPGSRDVINGIAVEPPEEDGEGPIADAARLVLEKDPFVNAAQIRVAARDATVLLTGFVSSESERRMAENDAWCLFGVDRVENRIDVAS